MGKKYVEKYRFFGKWFIEVADVASNNMLNLEMIVDDMDKEEPIFGVTFDLYLHYTSNKRKINSKTIVHEPPTSFYKLEREARKIIAKKCREVEKIGMKCHGSTDYDDDNRLVFINFRLFEREQLPHPVNLTKLFKNEINF